MLLVPTCGDPNGSIELDSLAKVNLMAGARKAVFVTSNTEWGKDLYLAPKMRRALSSSLAWLAVGLGDMSPTLDLANSRIIGPLSKASLQFFCYIKVVAMADDPVLEK
jgi:hypothetical protein